MGTVLVPPSVTSSNLFGTFKLPGQEYTPNSQDYRQGISCRGRARHAFPRRGVSCRAACLDIGAWSSSRRFLEGGQGASLERSSAECKAKGRQPSVRAVASMNLCLSDDTGPCGCCTPGSFLEGGPSSPGGILFRMGGPEPPVLRGCPENGRLVRPRKGHERGRRQQRAPGGVLPGLAPSP